MLRKMLCAIAACLATGAASADNYWAFSYKGFELEATGTFEPRWARITGSFRGHDNNADGILQQSELTEFSLDTPFNFSNPYGCYPLNHCILSDFSYNLRTGKLDFYAHTNYHDEAMNVDTTYVIGKYWTVSSTNYDQTWLWTENTRFEITPALVPEPAAAWLLGVGLVAVGAAARRRR